MDRRFHFFPCAKDRKEKIKKSFRKERVEKVWQEQRQRICVSKKYGKLGLKFGSYQNKITELPLKCASPIRQTFSLETSIFVQRRATVSAEQ